MRARAIQRFGMTRRSVYVVLAVVFVVWTAGIFMLLEHDGRRPPERAATGIDPTPATRYAMVTGRDSNVAFAVESLRRFVVRSETMARDVTYSSRGLRHLADAIEAIVARDSSIATVATCDSLRAVAARLRADPLSIARADEARAAFVDASKLLRALRRKALPDSVATAAPVVDAALSIEGDRRLQEQRPEVRRYFERSYQLIDRIVQSRNWN